MLKVGRSPFFHFFVILFENLLPAFVGEHDFENCINVKSHQKPLLRPSTRTDYTQSGPLYGTWNLQNRWEKCIFLVYVPSLEALFAPMCSTACISHENFIFSQCFRHDFASKLTMLEVTSHKYVRLPLPARYVVCMPPWCLWIHRIHVVLLESPTLNCMLYFALHWCAYQK